MPLTTVNIDQELIRLGQQYNCESMPKFIEAMRKEVQVGGTAYLFIHREYSSLHLSVLKRPDKHNKQSVYDAISDAHTMKYLVGEGGYIAFAIHTHELAPEHMGFVQFESAEVVCAVADKWAEQLGPQPVSDRSGALYLPDEYAATHFWNVAMEAERRGLTKQFQRAIQDRCVNNFQGRMYYRCILNRDGNPDEMNFYWVPQAKDTPYGEWRNLFVGGLIYHDYLKDWSTHT